ncbi:MAG TPA: peptidylprolyl isomerase [Thermoanaerobaculia bacterium]|nr:peptidylprolyl isomerase [Thermoanaerobaculia bacterium]
MQPWSTSRWALLAGLCCATLATSCRKSAGIPPQAIARVGVRYSTIDDFKRYLERNAGTDLAQMAPTVSSALLDQYLEEVLLSEYAALRGVEIPADVIAAAVRKDPGSTAAEKRDQLRRAQLVSGATADVPEPSAERVSDYYLRRKEEFATGEELHVRQILVRDEELANKIVTELGRGASFAELSEKHSTAPNAASGGDIGFVSRGQLPKLFEEEIFRMTPGAGSRVIRADSTFHIFQVDARRPAGVVELGVAEPIIRARIKEDSMRQALSDLLAKARRDVAVTILTKRLPFPYDGAMPRSKNE